MATSPIRVVLADDHAIVVAGIERLLRENEDIVVVGRARDGFEAVALARTLGPDVALLDYTMPRLDGALAAEQIRREAPHTRILMLSMHANIHYALRSLEAGAHGYVVKASDERELLEAIRSVHAGKGYISTSLVPYLAGYLSGPARHGKGLAALSPREFQLLRHMATGMDVAQCARAMHLSRSAVFTLRARLMAKLSLRTAGEIVRYALEHGIVA